VFTSYIEIDKVSYYLLEVDTSDTNKSLSTKVIQTSTIENVEKLLLKGSLSWPKEYNDNKIGANYHFGVSHQQSDKNGKLTHLDIINWSIRFYQRLC
jgi:hypothetical protein